MMLRRIRAIVLLYLAAASTVCAQSNADTYQQILDQAQREGLPAIVALVQTSNDKEWIGKAGVGSIENGTLLDIDKSFRLASISKIFTSVVVLQLIDEQRLNLQDPISDYLDDETISKIPYVDDINILHLLSHSSGIYSFTENNNFWKECYSNGGMSRTWPPNELVSYIDHKKPDHQPADPFSQRSYSNTNYILLGMIIEKITGSSLLEAYQNRILKPLGMNHTFLEGYDDQARKPIDSYVIPTNSFLKSAMKKKGIEPVQGSALVNLSQEFDLFNSWAWAAGGISSNVNDLSSFLSALKSGELLTEDAQKVLIQLNTSEDQGITFFGGTGGSDGIQATMLHLMPGDITIIILINSSGQKQVNLSSVFVGLYQAAANKN
jgi:D-alanyl-D-alanine carboxypeptidase